MTTTPASQHLPVAVVIPAFNEAASIGHVLDDLDPDWCNPVVVVDNGSTDKTAVVARSHGAIVVSEPRRGYGSACLAGISWVLSESDRSIVLFIDADYSDHPDEAHTLISPIVENQADLVIGSRISGEREQGAMPPQAIFGNWLSTRLIRMFWQESFTDLGPFRAIRRTTLIDIAMEDTNYGWTVEMQAKCAKIGARCTEVPVSYRKRIGRSKISGTISGSVKAGFKILWTIGRIALRANTNER